jgi:cyclohexyl-isocyanide hydratase
MTAIGMLVFDNVTQLDLTGPHEVLARMPGARVQVIAKSAAPIRSEGGLAIVPDATFATADPIDLLFVPGGYGQIAATADDDTLAFVRAAGERAAWVTSACTGALLLGAAGLLRGYRAATHWAFMDLLPLVGATPVAERVVIDRDRITGGGVTAGIDIALAIVERIASRDAADRIRVQLEYDPPPQLPPSPQLLDEIRAAIAPRHAERAQQLRR